MTSYCDRLSAAVPDSVNGPGVLVRSKKRKLRPLRLTVDLLALI